MACFTHLLNLLGPWFEFVTTLFIVVTVTKAEEQQKNMCYYKAKCKADQRTVFKYQYKLGILCKSSSALSVGEYFSGPSGPVDYIHSLLSV